MLDISKEHRVVKFDVPGLAMLQLSHARFIAWEEDPQLIQHYVRGRLHSGCCDR